MCACGLPLCCAMQEIMARNAKDVSGAHSPMRKGAGSATKSVQSLRTRRCGMLRPTDKKEQRHRQNGEIHHHREVLQVRDHRRLTRDLRIECRKAGGAAGIPHMRNGLKGLV